jgi:predicted MPP superfamily phosphohydrolase
MGRLAASLIAVIALFATLLSAPVVRAGTQDIVLPKADKSVRFAVIGDSGTGGTAQLKIAERLAAVRTQFPFAFALMLGDNLYGRERPDDFAQKFERPYKPLLDAGVKFYAALGNHDDPNQRFYKGFNMNGERYYSFKPPEGNVRFFALDSNYMDKAQLTWLEKELSASDSGWKICFFHHPVYSSGDKHGSDAALRDQLEPLFLKHGVDLVLTGHEHFYERLKPQKGIHYIISGSAAKLRRGNIARSALTAKGFDQGYAFLVMEIVGDQLHFQAITDDGRTVDSGSVQRRVDKTAGTDRGALP